MPYKVNDALKPIFKVNEDILFCAFRYALGRKTYIVKEVVDSIINNWDKLDKGLKKIFTVEIRQAIKKEQAGMYIDVLQWKRIINKFDGELNASKT